MSDSPEVKGTVVGMGIFNEFVPLKYTVEIRVSNNVHGPPDPPPMIDDVPELPEAPAEEDIDVNEK